MKKIKCIVIILFYCASFKTYAQWNKLPTQIIYPYYWSSPPFWPSGGGVLIFPAFLMPVADGHIFIADYSDNGSVSANSSGYEVFESFDDFSSHRRINFSDLYSGSFSPPYGGISNFIYSKSDSSFSWVGHAKYTYTYTNRYTKDDFQTTKSVEYCHPSGPPNLFNNCLTDSFLYSISASGGFYFGRSNLNNSSVFCKGFTNYAYVKSIIKSVNDSIVFFNCVDITNNSKNILSKTIDYGQSWNEIYVDSLNSIVSYNFTSENIGYILLSNGNLIKTSDGGNNWIPTTTPTSTVTCFSFFDDNLGYIGGKQGFLSKTIDGGQTWVNEISGSNYPLKEIFTVSNSVAYFKDSISALYKNTPILVSVRENNKSNGISVFPNPFNSIVNIESVKELRLITLYNVFGEIVLQINVKDNKTQIDLIKFAAGIYFVRIQDNYTRIIKE